MIGSSLSHFEITAKLGEGGMGEVWRGSDRRLGRDVAIKVLPEAFVADPERLARFEREARVLASLSHPNIAGIHDVGEADGRHFLVMELASGETLAERISRGPLPAEDALEIAGRIAEAVSAAHEQGIVHRDLKPGNVMVGPDGSVKVLDFGLAKALIPEPGSGSVPEISLSPTMTYQPTAAGVLLGTAAYMSPEQAKGRPVDRRADVWAWAAILFEMLTGKQPFEGDSVAEILASILRTEPDWDTLPAGIPPGVEPVLRHCLEKNPDARLRDVGDAILLIERTEAVESSSSLGADGVRPGRKRESLAWALAVVAAAVALALWWGREGATPEPSAVAATRFAVPLSDESRLAMIDEPILAFSPDGTAVAYVATGAEHGLRELFVRWLSSQEPVVLPGTTGASAPFFSPDGEWIAFFADGKLKKIPASGGPVVEIAGGTPTSRGGTWRADGSIVYSPVYSSGLWRVSSDGGVPEEIVPLNRNAEERTFRWPDTWPDGRSVLFTVGSVDSPNDYDAATIELWDAESGERRILLEGANMARVLPPDRLLYFRDNMMLLAEIDVDAGRIVGPGRQVLDGVLGEPASGAAYFAISATGSLAYAEGAADAELSRLVVVDREGDSRALELESRSFDTPRFSPDGSHLAFTIKAGQDWSAGDVWTWSLADRSLNRLTFDNGVSPLWTPGTEGITYLTTQGRLITQQADGAGEPRELWQETGDLLLPASWSPDGLTLALTRLGSSTDVFLLTEGEEPRLFEENASLPVFSPDGRWIAYSQPPSGETTVFVRPVKGPGKWQVSRGFGGYARWPANGKRNEIFYIGNRELGRSLLAVEVDDSEGFRVGAPQVVIPDTTLYRTATAPALNYDVDAQGERFVFVEPQRGETAGAEIQIILNWTSELGFDSP